MDPYPESVGPPSKRRKRTDVGEVDLISQLPAEIFSHVLSFLPDTAEAFLLLRLVSKRWREQSQASVAVWRSLFERRWHGHKPGAASAPADGQPLAAAAVAGAAGEGCWESYLYRSRLDGNWRRGIVRRYQVDSGHGCVCCVRVDGNRIFSSGEDRMIKEWNASNGSLSRVYSGHAQAVWSIQVQSEFMASAGGDSLVKLWSLPKHKCLHTFQEHAGEVWAVDLSASDNRLVSGGVDGAVLVYDLERRCRLQLLDHTSSVFAVQLCGPHLLASGSKDGSVRLYDLRCSPPAVALSPPAGSSSSLSSASSSASSSVFALRGTYRGGGRRASGGSPVFCLQFDPTKLVSGHGDGTVRVVDLVAGRSVSASRLHADSVWSLQYNGDYLVSGSVDASIKVSQWAPESDGSPGFRPLYSLVSMSSFFSARLDATKIVTGDSGGMIQQFDFADGFAACRSSSASPPGGGGRFGTPLGLLQAAVPASRSCKSPLFPSQWPAQAPHLDDEGKREYSIF